MQSDEYIFNFDLRDENDFELFEQTVNHYYRYTLNKDLEVTIRALSNHFRDGERSEYRYELTYKFQITND